MSLWDLGRAATAAATAAAAPDTADMVRKFTALAESSPRGVEGIRSGMLSPPPDKSRAGERITELVQYFFKEVRWNTFFFL